MVMAWIGTVSLALPSSATTRVPFPAMQAFAMDAAVVSSAFIMDMVTL